MQCNTDATERNGDIDIDIKKDIKIDIESEVDIGKPATENGSYTECIRNVYSLDTQISIDKIRLDKNSISSSIEQLEADTADELEKFQPHSNFLPTEIEIEIEKDIEIDIESELGC